MAGDMGCKNRLVIVKERLQARDFDTGFTCTVYGLCKDEKQKFFRLLGITGIASECFDLGCQRASKLIPMLEKMDYEFYNVSDNADAITDDKVVVTWRFMKKI